MLSHNKFKKKLLTDLTVKAEYDRLEEEFALLEQLISARKEAKLSQSEVAVRMGTKTPAISRIESSESHHSPSIRTLRRYAAAVGCKLEIALKPIRQRKIQSL